ncbi:Hypothetical_protein [Hexamita inflata]|uniref:Hypothetical_protein n=1 Tax=Hexamita inflata TaxID=28002 RepID=A0AA86QTY5_9EUKA|nr:Hypothetical protein HINF_LOCUS51733 [Hexamita inflata]
MLNKTIGQEDPSEVELLQAKQFRKTEPLTQRNPKPTQIILNGTRQLQTRNKCGDKQRAPKSNSVHSERCSPLPAVESIWVRMRSGNHFYTKMSNNQFINIKIYLSLFYILKSVT